MKSSQKGFTLIELVVVIVILGILAATALPKFIDLSTDARAAVIQGVEGSMRSANAMIYAKAATAGTMDGDLTITGVSGQIKVLGGFAATTADLVKAMDLDTSKVKVDDDVLSYQSKAACNVTYMPPTAASAGPPVVVAAPPAYKTVITGC